MTLDMEKILPLSDGNLRQRRQARGRWLLRLLLLALLIGAGYYAWRERGEAITAWLEERGTALSAWWTAEEAPPSPGHAAAGSGGAAADGSADAPDGPAVLLPSDRDELADSPRLPEEDPVASTADTAADGAGEEAGNGPSGNGPSGGGERAAAEAAAEITRQWRRVVALQKEGDHEAMEALLREILEAHPEDRHGGNALYWLGFRRWQAGKRDAARELWKRAYTDDHLRGTVGGRRAALALADLWYRKYCDDSHPDYGNWEPVRDAYSVAIGKDGADFLGEADRARVVRHLTKLNGRLVFSSAPCEDALWYEVKENDTLEGIAKRYGVHYDGIAAINGIRSDYIRVGQRLKIIPFSSLNTEVVIDKGRHTLTLYFKDKWIKQYPVCHGGERTPVGVFTVVDKAPQPVWTDPETGRRYAHGDPKNILGERWLGFEDEGPGRGIGIHGTTLPQSIPGSSSNGCIRMHNRDVVELYGCVILGSKATILE
jgi:tetratricopeptide (TPR) repeat protein